MTYYIGKVKAQVEELGLVFDEALVYQIEPELKEMKITQKQFDKIILIHARIVKDLFTPKHYSWMQRIAIALYFLGIIRGKKHGK